MKTMKAQRTGRAKPAPVVTRPVPAPFSPPGLRALGEVRAAGLGRLGLRTLREVLEFAPLKAARLLFAVAQGRLPAEAAAGLANAAASRASADQLASMPATALAGVGPAEAGAFAMVGIRSVGDLAQLAQDVDAAILAARTDNGFSERPSAPAELLPGMIGAVASTVRFATFVRDVELRKLRFFTHEDCVVPLPVSPDDPKRRASLGEIFENVRCPVVHLGYVCDHRQRWINLGTHLGEVVHSLALAPGESRNIAFVNWRRRQATSLEQQSRINESLSATFVQNRALEEVTSATAREHQSGGSATEANTSATALGVVGAIGLGAGLGAAIGTAVAPGVGTAVGAALGAGISGVAAAGVVSSGAQTLGRIEADTAGDREIVAEVQQRIALSTTQNASAVRSLWSTGVVEDTQAEAVEAQTSNITNYNHMHALNLEYYEVLQHYLARVELERVQPILFLPFTFFDFTGFRFIRDYWEAVRPHLGDAGLQAQGDIYFVQDDVPTTPDPPLPVPPRLASDPGRVTGLRLRISFTYDEPVEFGLAVIVNGEAVAGEEDEGPRTGGDVRYRFFSFPTIANPPGVGAVRVTVDRRARDAFAITVMALEGNLRNAAEARSLRNAEIARINVTGDTRTYTVGWSLPRLNASGADLAQVAAREAEIAAAEAENARRAAAHAALVQDHARFLRRLEVVILRRRHFFTRVLLAAIEPEEIVQILESLRIGHADAARSFGFPLSTIADTIPLGVTNGAIVLRMKRLDAARIREIGIQFRIDRAVPDLVSLFTHADATIAHFDDPATREGVARTDHVYLPTGGLFAEAVLGRSNSAEFLDLERYFNWQDAPIPHQAPEIAAVDTGSRFQRGEVNVTMPDGSLQVINPVGLPDPVTAGGALAALGNGGLFRDMSGATQLASIIGSLTTLAGQIGQAAAGMTGTAAQQALETAAQMGESAAGLAQSFLPDAAAAAGAAPVTQSQAGAALNQQQKNEQQSAAAAAPGSTTRPPSSTSEEIVRRAGGVAPRAGTGARSRTLNVRLRFESVHGIPCTFNVLDGLPKTFTLFNESDSRVAVADVPGTNDADIQVMGKNIDPTYTFPLPAWSASNAELALELAYASGSFKSAQTVDIPPTANVMIVTARFGSRDQTVTRTRTSSRTQALTDAIQEKFGVNATVAKEIAKVADFGFGFTAESSDSITDTDTTSGTTSTTVTEVLKVPTDALIVSVQFRS